MQVMRIERTRFISVLESDMTSWCLKLAPAVDAGGLSPFQRSLIPFLGGRVGDTPGSGQGSAGPEEVAGWVYGTKRDPDALEVRLSGKRASEVVQRGRHGP